jgi:hypothetical protein
MFGWFQIQVEGLTGKKMAESALYCPCSGAERRNKPTDCTLSGVARRTGNIRILCRANTRAQLE